MSSVQQSRAIRISFAVAAVLVSVIVIALFSYLIFTAHNRDRVAMEYEAARAASLVFEAYDDSGSVNPAMLPDAVVGFGVYDVNGKSLFRVGDAPSVLSPEHAELDAAGKTVMKDNVLRIVRPIGTLEVLRSYPRKLDEHDESGPPRGHEGSAMPNQPRAVLLDYDVSAQMQRSLIRRYAWVGAAVLMVALGGLLFMLSRRLRKYEDEAERQSRLVQLGHAARTLTHEIKNPIGAIKLQVGLLKRQLGDQQAESISVLDEEVDRINNLVERVRDFLHSSPGRVEDVDLVALASELPERFEFSVIVHSPPSALYIQADPERMRSVLNNLIQNAYESMRDSGTDAPVEVTVRGRKSEAVIEVDDAGPGIPAEERTRIFDPFYTTKPRGSGVGLAITKQFVDTMRGTIEILDRPGGGTRVRIVLKRTKAEKSA